MSVHGFRRHCFFGLCLPSNKIIDVFVTVHPRKVALKVVQPRPDLVMMLASLRNALITFSPTTNLVDGLHVSFQIVVTGEALLALAAGHMTSIWLLMPGHMLSDVMV